MPEKWNIRLRRIRLETIDPSTEKPMSQPRAATLIGCNVHTYRQYEYGLRLPHPMFRREMLRLWPGLFSKQT